MAKATFDIKSIEIPTVAAKPLYAGVGASDIALTAVKEYAADVSKKIAEFDPKSLRKQATGVAAARRDQVESRVSELQAEAKALPTKVQNTVIDNVSLASAAYTDLAKRGETVVTRIRKQNPTIGVQVKSTETKPVSVKATATKRSKPTTQPARKAPTAKKTVKKAAAKKASTKKAAAKKA